jgi:hypothetical protein
MRGLPARIPAAAAGFPGAKKAAGRKPFFCGASYDNVRSHR